MPFHSARAGRRRWRSVLMDVPLLIARSFDTITAGATMATPCRTRAARRRSECEPHPLAHPAPCTMALNDALVLELPRLAARMRRAAPRTDLDLWCCRPGAGDLRMGPAHGGGGGTVVRGAWVAALRSASDGAVRNAASSASAAAVGCVAASAGFGWCRTGWHLHQSMQRPRVRQRKCRARPRVRAGQRRASVLEVLPPTGLISFVRRHRGVEWSGRVAAGGGILSPGCARSAPSGAARFRASTMVLGLGGRPAASSRGVGGSRSVAARVTPEGGDVAVLGGLHFAFVGAE